MIANRAKTARVVWPGKEQSSDNSWLFCEIFVAAQLISGSHDSERSALPALYGELGGSMGMTLLIFLFRSPTRPRLASLEIWIVQ